jgi:hypothetical protein
VPPKQPHRDHYQPGNKYPSLDLSFKEINTRERVASPPRKRHHQAPKTWGIKEGYALRVLSPAKPSQSLAIEIPEAHSSSTAKFERKETIASSLSPVFSHAHCKTRRTRFAQEDGESPAGYRPQLCSTPSAPRRSWRSIKGDLRVF